MTPLVHRVRQAAILRPVVLLLGLPLFGAALLSASEPQPPPGIEFHDRYIPGAAIYKADPGVVPWTEEDKQAFLEHWRWLQKRVPGLTQRATAYRPLRLYRVPAVKGGARTLLSRYLDQSLSIEDRFLRELREQRGYHPQLLHQIAHECAHLHDALYRIAWSKEWVAFAQPRILRVQQRFQEQSGMKAADYVWQKPDQKDPQWGKLLNDLAREEGLPRGYGSLNLQESLADIVGHVALRSKFPVPQEIKDLVVARFTATPWEPDPNVRAVHQGFAALYEGRADEAIARFSTVLAQEPEYLMLHEVRGVAYRMRRDYDLAIADFTRVVELGPALHSESLRQRATLYLQTGKRTQATADCQRLLRDDSEPAVQAWAVETLKRLQSR